MNKRHTLYKQLKLLIYNKSGLYSTFIDLYGVNSPLMTFEPSHEGPGFPGITSSNGIATSRKHWNYKRFVKINNCIWICYLVNSRRLPEERLIYGYLHSNSLALDM